jgi:hypothetical protein
MGVRDFWAEQKEKGFKKFILPMLDDLDYDELEKNIYQSLKNGEIAGLNEHSKIKLFFDDAKLIVKCDQERKDLKTLMDLILKSIAKK